ncbi:hypothetical protein SPRG_03927 [Saprolegnia parasitica CBS 223.65]|uniref:RING-type domain-containing protein n=1 Tax=Saprolegnia parasitica (strain CBS 223.65) TaxID=695850 RepID=A0A067CXS0_SAPPC|nr:hypothetical protein SPRG_03927 [Saprolegnia parasitica CBS 223.65]KDO31311.1 hypothetical protein SPRG_03927 [Saprolegnia parasitica CBS 223.65]|eukprot:XP_012197910.1 hypothetical protein SPRG_03927 [Saprolegnia parasitica CBS 223.65]
MAARLVPYRGKVPDAIRTKIDDTIGRTMYLVQTTGPTNYVIQEQNSSVKFRVLIGAVQSCTCGDKDVCCHLLFVMLKILRVPRTNPVVWQKSLIDSEITTLLSGGYSEETSARAKPAFLRRKLAPETPEVDETTKKQVATRHALVEGEVCAICQEEMVESEKNLTYCKHGCGNNFHIDCMKVFGESRKQSKEPISCPLCRHDWGDSALTELKKEADISNRNPLVHTGTTCKQCQTKPIRCNRYRCLQCKHTDLCERCFKSNAHAKHSFVLRKAHKGTWFPALRSLRDALLSPQAINDLEGRELSHADYDLLCELDAAEKYPLQDYLMANLVGDKLGAAQAKEWAPANPDVSIWCTLCTQGLRMSMDIRQLPCHHTFHESCLLQHVLAQKYHCPIEHCPHVLFPGLANEGGALAKKERKIEPAASSTALPPIGLMSVVSLMKKPNGTIEPLTGIRRPSEPQTTDPARRHKAHALKPLSTSNQQENDLAGIVTASACQAPARPGTPPGHGLRKSTRVLPHMPGAFQGSIVTSDNRVEDDASSSRLRLPALGSKEPSLSPTATRLAQAQVTRDLNRAQSQDRKRRQKIALVERKQQHAPGPSSLLPLQVGPQATTIDETSRQERVAQATLEKQIKVKAERERKHELAKFRRQEQADRERCPLSLG